MVWPQKGVGEQAATAIAIAVTGAGSKGSSECHTERPVSGATEEVEYIRPRS